MTNTLARAAARFTLELDRAQDRARSPRPPTRVERDLAAVVDRIGAWEGQRAVPGWLADMPDGVRLGVLSIVAGWLVGSARSGCGCDPARLPAVAAAAWRPDTVTCVPHMAALALAPGSVADRTCDLCGTVTDLADDGVGGIHPHTITTGGVLFLYGACGDCHRPIVTETSRA